MGADSHGHLSLEFRKASHSQSIWHFTQYDISQG